jgi:tetratricopeptide (TPR) repeat protein
MKLHRMPLVLVFSWLVILCRADHFGAKLGTIQFDVSGNDAAREHVVRGVKLLHHMMYVEADREFAAAVEADPNCALAYWGRAMAIVHPLWPDVPTAAELKQGEDFIAAGLARGPKTPRERAYLVAIQAYYAAGAKPDHPTRLTALDEAWERLAREHPGDLDAAAFSALFHLAPARFMPKDKSHRIQLTAVQTIQDILAKVPDHPGAQHYKIHAFDFPLLADRALEVCDSYSSIAPDVPHALHMPTHIYTRRGLWEKSIEYNRRSELAARKLGFANKHQLHAQDYMVYAYLQRGQYRSAEAVRDEILGLKGPYEPASQPIMAFALAAIPARCALEKQDWTAAAALEVRSPGSFHWTDAYLHCDSMVRFARALGAARIGKLEITRKEIAELERLKERIAATYSQPYWKSQTETQLLASRAWLSLAAGAKDEALALMQHAAKLEATADKEAVTPGELIPAGELLGDLLREMDRPREALAAYEGALETSPNRLNGLFGAGRAAELAGDTDKAARYYQDVLKLTADGDAGIARLQPARAFLLARGKRRAE